MESHDTVHDLSGTRQAIRELELDGKAVTTIADAFIHAVGVCAGNAPFLTTQPSSCRPREERPHEPS
jgi:hypothetical protein